MSDKIKSILSSLSDEEVLTVYASGVDLDTRLSKKTADSIKKKTLQKLGISYFSEKRRHVVFSIKAAVGIIVAAVLAFTAVCAVSQPMRDRIRKIFNGYSNAGEEYVHLYLESPEYTPERYPVTETIDFSDFDFSLVNKLVVTSGRTGEVKAFYEIEKIMAKIESLRGDSPVSSRGYSGFGYNVKMFNGGELLFEFSIGTADGKMTLYYGVYEEFDNKKYSCMYSSDLSVKEAEEMFDDIFGR